MLSRKRHPCRRLPFLAACFVFCLAVVGFYAIYLDREERIPFQVLADDTVRDFMVNTPGCQIPAWNPWDDSVKSFFEPVWKPYKCPGQPSFLRVLPNAIVSLDVTLLRLYYEVEPQNVSCTYRVIHRDTSVLDEDVDSRYRIDRALNLSFDVPLEVDFIRTECTFLTRDATPFVEFLPLTPLKAGVEERCVNLQAATPMQRPLNVLFLGLDSISNLNFLRHFPKCKKYMAEFLSPVNMKGYVKVGDNTFPNLMPLLTGHFSQHYYDESLNRSMFFDDVDFAWKAFAKHGYRTFFAEDAPDIATFNYYRKGFKRPPTDYYYRPFALAVEESEVRNKQCFGSKMEMEVLYDYLRSFIDTMGSNRPFFAFLFLARLTHDVFNYAGYADGPTAHLLRHLVESGALENTMLVFYSDHGIRYGPIRKTYIGQFEERMPFMNVILPEWFLKKHENMAKNLKANSERLTTPFDVHATVMHLASLITGDAGLESVSGPGISLFREIPANRTCSKAAITPHWCPCQIHKPVPVTDAMVVRAAQAVIRTVNFRTRRQGDKCAHLSLLEVLDSRVAEVEKDSNSTNSGAKLDYLVVLSVSPSEAVFEATVRCDAKTEACDVTDDVSRINEYGLQSRCISDTVLKKFCFCL